MNPEDEVVNENQNYIDAINELKANSVDKAKYEKLKAENKQLLDTLVAGGSLEQKPIAEKADIAAMRQDLFNNRRQLTNLDFVERMLELRNAVMEDGGDDPFLPFGVNTQRTQADYDAARKCAEMLQECVDAADHNPEIFNAQLKTIMR